jgi:hypothetical protein
VEDQVTTRLWLTGRQFLLNHPLKPRGQQDPESLLLGLYPREIKTCIRAKLHKRPNTAQFITARGWKPPSVHQQTMNTQNVDCPHSGILFIHKKE